ncbi:hypothetical protein [Flavobacterium taihuense]|uniref:Tetratricopeptide repeat protein n=1 Tax=Flavobacterium taihuense TaxID=2857508 RepID=A0ABS6XRU0_9FLAO|nr:hypothetical protein [Flavobacterium taihuense]MBW4359383.1 hypothetical protein [Flavobacterium taihuense]
MKTAIEIVKNIVFPQLEKDPKFSKERIDYAFWEKFTIDLLHYEKDAQSIYASIYSLELANTEKVIDKLPSIYAQFLKEQAESSVLGQTSYATDYLLKTNNEVFLKEVHFLETMQQAIKSVERKRIKADLPTSYEKLTFELSETDLANAIKKKGREDLRVKFKQWDTELGEQESVPVISMLTNEKEKTKVISLSWMKYASIVAIFIIGFMVWQPNKLSNDNLFSQYNSDESIIQSIDYQKMATISESGDVRGGEILFQNYTKSETDEAMEAIELFKNNNFEKSKQLLITLNPKEKNNQLLLFLAIAQLKTNEVNQAVSNLEYLNTITNYEFADEVKFHLALGYINQNEKRKAKDLLITLVHTNNKYSNTAQEILDNMRWF